MHTLIVGSNQSGMGAFIDKLLLQLNPKPDLYGYRSVKESPDKTGACPIYIYPAVGKRSQEPKNLLGWCREQQSIAFPEVFEQHTHLISSAKLGGLLVMDEIGPMESRSPRFCAAVMAALEKDIPILACVRDKDTPFLEAVRDHKNARCFSLTQKNAGCLYDEVLEFLELQIEKGR